MAANPSNKQVFDVEKPGKSAPSPTSRPVIINHGPMLKDPMVSKPDDEEAKPAEPALSPTDSHTVITPPSENKPEDTTPAPAAETEEETPKESAEQTKEAEQKRQTETKKEAAIVEAVADQAATKKKGELTKEDAARLAELEKLVEAQKYFVPIGHTAHHRQQKWLIIALLLLVVLAGAYLAADAGLLDIGIELPYNVIP